MEGIFLKKGEIVTVANASLYQVREEGVIGVSQAEVVRKGWEQNLTGVTENIDMDDGNHE